MSNLAERPSLAAADYLAGEADAAVKHEFVDGFAYAMADADEAHVTVAGNVFALLRAHLRACVRNRPCRVYISDMKLHVRQANAFYYPDVFVTFAAADADRRQAKEQAKVIIEVLSDSTEADDRGEKFAHYRLLPSLEQYCLIGPRRRSVEVFTRRDDGWLLRAVAAQGQLVIASLDFACDLDAVYEDVRFAPDPAPDTDVP